MTRAPRTLAARTVAAFHTAVGRFWWRCGVLERARRHLELALAHGADPFVTQVRIGRVAHAAGDFLGWRRACRAAHEHDAERFAALAHPFPLFDGNDRPGPDLRPRPRPARPFTSSTAGPIGADLRPDPTAAAAGGGDEPSGRDDCVDHGERDRFRRRGPIRTEEITAVDLDDLGDRLAGGPP